MKPTGRNILAKLMKNVAGKSAQAAAESRCMYIYHQPKQPAGLKRIKK
ncbi:cyclic lactone autoinducer peptide [Lachnospiraceae bacterium 54-11]|jgi:cyclic lactone autoinducer peptide|nr:cyclic lactone autoinducer peptide [Lachnospiraceae bacterium]